MARSESNKIIAATIGVAEGTIKAHVLNIFRKLEVDDRTAAVTVALRRGIRFRHAPQWRDELFSG